MLETRVTMFGMASALVSYLRRAAPIHTWRLARNACPRCGPSLFLALHADPFMTRCLRCAANVTNLSLIPVVRGHFAGGVASRSAYELSTYGSTLDWLRANFGEVTTSEYFPDRAPGEWVDGIQNQDAQRLTFADASFDAVTSNQVFEHVPEDLQAYAECLRVLRPGGCLVFSVPLYGAAQTERIAVVEAGAIRFLHRPEYHDSRLAGARSAPVFWHHSLHDICERVRSVGFERVSLVDVVVTPVQSLPAQVVYAVKAS